MVIWITDSLSGQALDGDDDDDEVMLNKKQTETTRDCEPSGRWYPRQH